MSKKHIKYYYDENTLSYQRCVPKPGERFMRVLTFLIIALLLGFAAFLGFSNLFESPSAKRLREENERMVLQYELLLRQTRELEEVMDELEKRDDNMYRAILQAEPADNRRTDLEHSARYEMFSDLSHSGLVKNTSRKVDELAHRIYAQSKSYDELVDLMRYNEDRLAHLPAIQPVENSKLKREASGYGVRIDPIYKKPKFHAGMDFSVPVGSDVYATADGVVTYTGYQRGGYGNLVIVDHGYGYTTYYAHLKNTNRVRKGQKVKRGDVIAESGNTGKSTGPHLHYEVRFHGKPDNPVHYYFQDLTAEEYDDMLRDLADSGMPMD